MFAVGGPAFSGATLNALPCEPSCHSTPSPSETIGGHYAPPALGKLAPADGRTQRRGGVAHAVVLPRDRALDPGRYFASLTGAGVVDGMS